MTRKLGVDVSHWNRENERTVLTPLDWEGLRDAGVEFGFAKATQGTGFVDPRYEHNEGEMRRLGIVPGAYHWLEHGQPERECQHFFDVVGDVSDLRIALDVEQAGVTGDDVRRWLREQRILARGHKVFTYTSESKWRALTGDMNIVGTRGAHPLWHAAYGANREYPIEDVDLAAVRFAVDYGGWKRASIRQIGSRITYRGRRLDVNVETY